MPKYDFKCDNCDMVYEIEKSMHSPHPTKCAHCGADGLRRVWNALPFSMRGEHLRVTRPKVETPPGMTIQPRSK